MKNKEKIKDEYIEYLWRLGLEPKILFRNENENIKTPKLICHTEENVISKVFYKRVYGIEVVVVEDLVESINLMNDTLHFNYLKGFQHHIGPIFFLLIVGKKPPDLKFLCLIPFNEIIEYYSDNIWSSLPIKFFDEYCIFDLDKQFQYNTPDPDISLEISKYLENEI